MGPSWGPIGAQFGLAHMGPDICPVPVFEGPQLGCPTGAQWQAQLGPSRVCYLERCCCREKCSLQWAAKSVIWMEEKF